jgi:hypothetical protein
MTDIDNVQASQRILAHLHEGRLVQGSWHTEKGGREFACLLGAISPHIESPRHCPASVMPKWLASLTVSMFDGQDRADAMTWAARFGTQMARWHVLDRAAWDRVRDAFCATCVADARQSADTNAAAAAWAAWAAWAAADAADAAARSAADAAAAAASAAVDWAAARASAAAREACWTRMATALCDLIDAELEAAK